MNLPFEPIDQATCWAPGRPTWLLPYATPGYSQSAANGINNNNWIVGYEYSEITSWDRIRGVLWAGTIAYDLTSLVQQPAGGPHIHIWSASDINNRNQIVGTAVVNGVKRAIRLDPIP